jgi:hypothetical protein
MAEQKELNTLINMQTHRPLAFFGAGGKSWESIPRAGKEEFTKGLDLLLKGLNPLKMYFVKGRTKSTGINAELEKAIVRHNEHHEEKFSCVTLLAESETTEEPAMHFYTMQLHASLMNLPDAIIRFLHERKGVALYAGGNNFTRDFILASTCPEYAIPFGLMQKVSGASKDKGAIYTGNNFEGAEDMLEYTSKICPEIFINS